jgi:2-oxoglutarate ferredoxin oxidoreductase subunit beta
MGVSFVASGISSKVKDLSQLITDAMNHRGFSIVHVQSPCTTYNDTYELLKGNVKKGIDPVAWDLPDDYDPTDIEAAHKTVNSDGVPLGTIFRDDQRSSFDQRIAAIAEKAKPRAVDKVIASYSI